jgi:hypothetical protein
MSKGYPCPNPNCTHVFPAEALRGATTLKCPQCGLDLAIRTNSAAPAPPRPAEPEPEAAAFDLGGAAPPRVQRTIARRKSSRWSRWVTPAVLLGLLAAAVAAAVIWLPRLVREMKSASLLPGPSQGEADLAGGSTVESPALNYRFTLPDAPWHPDLGEARQGLKATLVLRRDEPEAWLAFWTRDYQNRTPGADELREEAVRRLEGYFTDSLESESGGEATLAGRRAARLVFRGGVGDASYAGECVMLAHQGVGYWIATWTAGSLASARGDFADLRRRVSLLKENREGWKERPAGQTFTGHEGRYTLRDDVGVWKEWTPATDYDPTADLALVAKEAAESGPKLELVSATFLVLRPKAAPAGLDEALKAARDHAEEQQKSLGLSTKFEPVSAAAEQAVGGVSGRALRLNIKLGETKERFLLLVVVKQGVQTFVVQGECDGRRRTEWEPRFVRLLNSWQWKSE